MDGAEYDGPAGPQVAARRRWRLASALPLQRVVDTAREDDRLDLPKLAEVRLEVGLAKTVPLGEVSVELRRAAGRGERPAP